MSQVFRLDRRAVRQNFAADRRLLFFRLSSIVFCTLGYAHDSLVDRSEYRYDFWQHPAWPVFAGRLSPVFAGTSPVPYHDRPAGLSLSGGRRLSGRGSALAVFHPVHLAGVHGAVRQHDADPGLTAPFTRWLDAYMLALLFSLCSAYSLRRAPAGKAGWVLAPVLPCSVLRRFITAMCRKSAPSYVLILFVISHALDGFSFRRAPSACGVRLLWAC